MADNDEGIVLPPGVTRLPGTGTGTEPEAEQDDLTPEQILAARMAEIHAMSHDDLVDGLPQLRETNRDNAMALAREGAQLDPMSVIMQRLESIILVGFDEDTRLRIDFAFEQAVGAALLDAAQQVRMAKLTQGLGPMPPGMRPPGGPGQMPNGRPRRG